MSKQANHHLLNSSASAEWFTPQRYIEVVRVRKNLRSLWESEHEHA